LNELAIFPVENRVLIEKKMALFFKKSLEFFEIGAVRLFMAHKKQRKAIRWCGSFFQFLISRSVIS
jgi:hypothetical protein